MIEYTFENGEVNGWAGYPPSQDTAFDPSLYIGNEGRPVLTRAIRPNRRGLLEIGLIRKLGAVASARTHLSIRCCLKSPAAAESLRVVLCGDDGRQYASVIRNPARNRWTTIDIAAGVRLHPGIVIEAIYLLATIPDADPDHIVKLFIDAVRISGCRRLIPSTAPLPDFRGPSDHPRLFWDRTGVKQLRARAASSRYRGLWKGIKARAASLRAEVRLDRYPDIRGFDHRHLLPTFAIYAEMLTRSAELVGVNAFVYGITGDRAAGAAGKAALLEMCRWETYTHPWIRANGMHTYWPVGVASSELAMGYDMLHPLLSGGERALVREALLNKVIVPAWREYAAADRVPFNTSNWIGIITGGALTCAGAIAGEVADPAALRRYTAGILRKLRRHIEVSFTSDGGYGEGLSYQFFDLTHLLRGAEVMERLFGIDLIGTTPLKGCLLHPLYVNRMENNIAVSFGDSRENAPETSGAAAIPYLVERSGDPHFQWYLRKLVGARIRGTESSNLSRSVFLHPPAEEGARAPNDLSRCRVFPRLGNAVFRSGWGANAVVGVFKCGPYYNHHHFDQGTMTIAAFGETLLGEGGFTDYYEDPHYQSYFIQPVAHNVLIVDGDPESQRTGDYLDQEKALTSRCSIEEICRTREYSHVRGVLHPVYRGRLARYTREIVYLPAGFFIVRDTVETKGGPRDLRLRFHPPNKPSLEMRDGGAMFRGRKGALAILPFADRALRTRVVDVPTPQWEFQPNTAEMRVIKGIMGKDAAARAKPAQPRASLEIGLAGPARTAEFLTLMIVGSAGTDVARVRESADVTRDRDGWLVLLRHGGRRRRVRWGIGAPVVEKRS